MAEHEELGASTVEMEAGDGTTRTSHRAAHSRAGDPDNKVFLPATCWTCWKQELSAQEAIGRSPTRPDEEWSVDG